MVTKKKYQNVIEFLKKTGRFVPKFGEIRLKEFLMVSDCKIV